jgi:hypothetical protein
VGDVPSELRYVGRVPDSLYSGRPLAPGDYLKAEDLDLGRDDDQPSEDQRLLDDGLLIDANPPEAPEASEPETGLRGKALEEALEARGLSKSGTADEQRARVAEYDQDNPGGEPA